MSSPAALQQYNADQTEQSGEAFTYGPYATDHPTGTGPFKFESYDRTANVITLVRNDEYWGEKAKVEKLIFKIIPDENARKQELQAGTIDGYDYPNARRLAVAARRGLQRPDPPGVQHPLPGHQPEEQPGAAGPAGAPGHRLRH